MNIKIALLRKYLMMTTYHQALQFSNIYYGKERIRASS